jgi:hypothetical protein
VRAGHEVTVICTAPNFPKGALLAGYRNRLWHWEDMGGFRVLRVWTYISANSGFVKRILDYLSFMVSGFIAGLFVRRPDVIVGTSPQFFTNCAGWMLSAFRRRPFVFELRDLWPESIKTVGAMKDSMVLRLMERLELFLYRKSAAIVAVTESFKRDLVRRGIDHDKIHVVTNGVDLSRFKPVERDNDLLVQVLKKSGADGRVSDPSTSVQPFVVGYIGTHGLAHALEAVLVAAKMLQDVDGRSGRPIHFILLGDGARKESLKARALELGLANVSFLDSVPKAEVPRYWSLLDASIIHLRKADNFTQVIPSKLFECMGMGIPVLHGVAGESAEIVGREDVGLVFESENPQALCDCLLRLASDSKLYARLQENCLAAAPKYDRTVLAQKMLEVLEGIEEIDRDNDREGV